MLRAVAVSRAIGAVSPERPVIGTAILQHDERHLRRRVIELTGGDKLLVDLPSTLVLEDGDALLTENGDAIHIVAAPEPLYEIEARDALHLTELAWHLGNRHLAAAIEPHRILILRDHVIRAMLEGLGARVTDIVAAFQPVRGAYSGGGGHGHAHDNAPAPRADEPARDAVHAHTHAHTHEHVHAHTHAHEGHSHEPHSHEHHDHHAHDHHAHDHHADDHHADGAHGHGSGHGASHKHSHD